MSESFFSDNLSPRSGKTKTRNNNETKKECHTKIAAETVAVETTWKRRGSSRYDEEENGVATRRDEDGTEKKTQTTRKREEDGVCEAAVRVFSLDKKKERKI